MIDYHIEITEGAKIEIRLATSWYNTEKSGLGKELFSEIENLLNRIAENPYQFPIMVKNIRRAICPKFPYSIFFTMIGDRLPILAVFHTKQNPEKLPFWK